MRCGLGKKKPFPDILEKGFKKSGSVLLSRTVTHAVPSALEGLTSVFEMGTGVTPPLSLPKRQGNDNFTFAA